MKYLLTLLVCFLSIHVTAQEATCGSIAGINAVRADDPLVKAAPMYPNQGTLKPISGCAVITFSLVAKPGTDGKALIPERIEVFNSSEPRFGEAASTAISKWLYLSKNIEKASEYFTVIHFEIE